MAATTIITLCRHMHIYGVAYGKNVPVLATYNLV